MEIVWLLVSLVILYFGAEGLVSGAASLAKRVGNRVDHCFNRYQCTGIDSECESRIEWARCTFYRKCVGVEFF